MNIIVRTYSGHTITRPDTTWKLNLEKIYLPDTVGVLSWTPVVFARISRPCKGVGLRFARRYFDGIGFGVLLYPENWISGCPEGFASASCVDNTSIFPSPLYNAVTLGREGNLFEVLKDGELLFCAPACPPETVDEALCSASASVLMRTGDYLAAELQPRSVLMQGRGSFRLRGRYCSNETFDKTIIV